ncbi:tachykinin-like peptides receptor 86C [Biomphalaria pfeifferi]|uniref:Tachykinin-like peptides receptor 86C n=1 Tax=Biomphalaria pfeifferi TaxID=112525 RepID=A0AAD8BKJ2_BIOPF|nr:tachykinin-like peptides receptor 86C [Biomphalaria pfeifferi]
MKEDDELLNKSVYKRRISTENDNVNDFDLDIIVITIPTTLVVMLDLMSNMINILVFVAQGLETSVNISLFTISLMDLVRIVFLLISIFYLKPFADLMEVPESLFEVFYVTVASPLGSAIRITLHITVYIAIERCLCVVFPIKIKRIITRKTTVCIILAIIGFNGVTLYPIYSVYSLSWDFYFLRNSSGDGRDFLKNWSETLENTFLFHSMLIVSGLGTLVVYTALLVDQYARRSEWRKTTARHFGEKRKCLSARDRKTMKLVVAIATLLIVCFTPTVVDSMIVILTPDYYFWEGYSSLFHYLYNISLQCLSINSTLNMFIYYKMSTRYRNTFKELFCSKLCL